jgi:superfamily II DNA/RNA helicase
MTTTFTDLGVPADVVARLVEMDRATPFLVQERTLPDALAGRDLCVQAPTGSGKTLAFALPAALRGGRGEARRPRTLVLIPTRELATQVAATLSPLAQVRRRRVATVFGGTNITRDQRTLRHGIDILVATPGRLADLIQRGDADLGHVDLVIIDEADRMADMGFLPAVSRRLDRTSPDRQTLLFSATLEGDVDRLIRRYQTDPVRHEVAAIAEERGDVRHAFWAAGREERRRLTGQVARRSGSTIVFTRTKHGADRLAKQLVQDGVRAAAIHGNRTQGQRERALEGFRSGAISTIVATDVAARGIHVDAVEVVVHFDLAGSDTDYVHRSGRTGRAGADGLVISLVDAAQRKEVTAIQRALALPLGLHRVDTELVGSDARPELVERWGGDTRRRAGDSSPSTRARHTGTGGRTGGGGRNGGARTRARSRVRRRQGSSGTRAA